MRSSNGKILLIDPNNDRIIAGPAIGCNIGEILTAGVDMRGQNNRILQTIAGDHNDKIVLDPEIGSAAGQIPTVGSALAASKLVFTNASGLLTTAPTKVPFSYIQYVNSDLGGSKFFYPINFDYTYTHAAGTAIETIYSSPIFPIVDWSNATFSINFKYTFWTSTSVNQQHFGIIVPKYIDGAANMEHWNNGYGEENMTNVIMQFTNQTPLTMVFRFWINTTLYRKIDVIASGLVVGVK